MSIGGHHDKLLIFEPQKNIDTSYTLTIHMYIVYKTVKEETKDWSNGIFFQNERELDKYFIIGNHDIILDVIDYLVSALI